MSADLGAIKRKLGPRKRHVNLNIQAAKEVKQRPIEGDLDLEQLLDDTREKRDQLQQPSINPFVLNSKKPRNLLEKESTTR